MKRALVKVAAYQAPLLPSGFRDWRLTVDGLVARPSTFSLADLRGYPSHTQITHQACEEGWSFIAEWTGARLSYVLDLVGIDPRARYVVFVPFDDFWEASTWTTPCIFRPSSPMA